MDAILSNFETCTSSNKTEGIGFHAHLCTFHQVGENFPLEEGGFVVPIWGQLAEVGKMDLRVTTREIVQQPVCIGHCVLHSFGLWE